MLSERYKKNQKPEVPLNDQQLKHLEEIKNKIRKKKYKFLNSFCICGLKNKDIKISEIDRYGININTCLCTRCGSLRLNPYLNDKSIKDFYSHHYQKLYDRYKNIDHYFDKQRHYGKYIYTILKLNNIKFNSIFEFGCGAGGALNYFFEKGFSIGGNEYSLDLLNFIRKKKISKYINSGLGSSKKKYDVLYFYHVFEHISDPKNYLLDIKKKMHDKSIIIVAVPDITRIDKFVYPAGNLKMYLHLAHKFNFTETGIKCLFYNTGLKLKKTIYNSKESEVFFIAQKSHKNNNKIYLKKNEGLKIFNYLKKTDSKYKFFLNQGQYLYLHLHLFGKIISLIPSFIKKKIKIIFNKNV